MGKNNNSTSTRNSGRITETRGMIKGFALGLGTVVLVVTTVIGVRFHFSKQAALKATEKELKTKTNIETRIDDKEYQKEKEEQEKIISQIIDETESNETKADGLRINDGGNENIDDNMPHTFDGEPPVEKSENAENKLNNEGATQQSNVVDSEALSASADAESQGENLTETEAENVVETNVDGSNATNDSVETPAVNVGAEESTEMTGEEIVQKIRDEQTKVGKTESATNAVEAEQQAIDQTGAETVSPAEAETVSPTETEDAVEKIEEQVVEAPTDTQEELTDSFEEVEESETTAEKDVNKIKSTLEEYSVLDTLAGKESQSNKTSEESETTAEKDVNKIKSTLEEYSVLDTLASEEGQSNKTSEGTKTETTIEEAYATVKGENSTPEATNTPETQTENASNASETQTKISSKDIVNHFTEHKSSTAINFGAIAEDGILTAGAGVNYKKKTITDGKVADVTTITGDVAVGTSEKGNNLAVGAGFGQNFTVGKNGESVGYNLNAKSSINSDKSVDFEASAGVTYSMEKFDLEAGVTVGTAEDGSANVKGKVLGTVYLDGKKDSQNNRRTFDDMLKYSLEKNKKIKKVNNSNPGGQTETPEETETPTTPTTPTNPTDPTNPTENPTEKDDPGIDHSGGSEEQRREDTPISEPTEVGTNNDDPKTPGKEL